MRLTRYPYCLLAFLLAFFTSRGQKPSADTTLFRLVSPSYSGIQFNNRITESDSINILQQANLYNGGGVGIGDFNNDGLQDIYFAGNMVENKLYLNKGKLAFSDITATAGVGGRGHWCTGVSVVDINADGWNDIYVAASFRNDATLRTNLLYINKGLNKQGIPVFVEEAAKWGIADKGFSTQGFFFDYDRDGDLDLYLVTNELYDPKTPIRFRPKLKDGTANNTDRLYRNNGNETFTNVSKAAGILTEGWGHAACITDINLDGWPDIYVANDFVSNDLLYINNGDGTFTDRLTEYFKHTGWNAMGTDMSDINNDGWIDLVSLEMLPEDNLRKKRMLAGNEYYNYFNSRQYGYSHQYVRNVLQVNKGLGPDGHPVFSELGYMAGMFETDWSWCPLVADFDNDGLRDLVITNGLPRDVTDLDYITFNNGQGGSKGLLNLAMASKLPVVQLPNYAFRNMGNASFANSSGSWGITHPSFSNGAAYADMDNDGDLDIIMNNLNDVAFLYENRQMKKVNQLRLQFKGSRKNTRGIGAKVHLYYDGKQQVYEHQPCRGYLSTVDDRPLFSLGHTQYADSLVITWPDGGIQKFTQLFAGKQLLLEQSKALPAPATFKPAFSPLLTQVNTKSGIQYKHREKDAIDYNRQSTIPHKLSQYGPGLAVGDIDNNGKDDIYIGGSVGNKGCFFLQDDKGNFHADSTRIRVNDGHPGEDMGALLFDADNDGDNDLYIVSGSYELAPDQPSSQDVLYFNDGNGYFEPRYSALPKMFSNGSCVRAADFDSDGDLDLFVAGRIVSGAYPLAPPSMLLMNLGGSFSDVTEKYCPELKDLGMITDALWSDYDNDGRFDLVVTGEWKPVLFFKNEGTRLTPLAASGIEKYSGWWNSIAAADFDHDGDIDYVAGNLGLNSNYKASFAEPLQLIANDFDGNGLVDPIVFCYMNGFDEKRRPYPLSARDDMVSQMISIRKRFPTYSAYGKASLNELLTAAERQNAITFSATHMASSYIENKGNGRFELSALPLAAQEAPVFGMLAQDVDRDGNPDLLLTGNDYGMEPYSGRHDAFKGLFMKGDGKGSFTPWPIFDAGFFVDGDAKALSVVKTVSGPLFVITQNQDSVLVFERSKASLLKTLATEPSDVFAEIFFKDNKRQKVEFYYGNGFLSQSSRFIEAPKSAVKIIITNNKGERREALPVSH